MRRREFLALGAMATVAARLPASETPASPAILRRAHSHNDYNRPRPLLDALDNGFCSVEADVFAVDGELLVGHDRHELASNRTLRAMYLEPLLARARGRGAIHEPGDGFQLLVDFKSGAGETLAALRPLLAEFRPILARVEGGGIVPGPVTVIISGKRPVDELRAATSRLAFLDGRLLDLDGDAGADLFPMVSAPFSEASSWKGLGPMSAATRDAICGHLARARSRGMKLRYWGASPLVEVHPGFHATGIDWIGSDTPAALREAFARPARDGTGTGGCC